jgi:hypothetical protein
MGIFEVSMVFRVNKEIIKDMQQKFRLNCNLNLDCLDDDEIVSCYYIKHWSLRTIEIYIIGDGINECMWCCNKRYMPFIQEIPEYLTCRAVTVG